MLFRAVLAVLTVGIYGWIYKVHYPILTQQVALRQLEDTPESFTNFATWQLAWNLGWIPVVVVVVLLFLPVIRKIGKAFSDEQN